MRIKRNRKKQEKKKKKKEDPVNKLNKKKIKHKKR